MGVNRIVALLSRRAWNDSVLSAERVGRQLLPPGTRVRIQKGAFAGTEGTAISYCSASRLRIAVDIDCCSVFIEIDLQAIDVLD